MIHCNCCASSAFSSIVSGFERSGNFAHFPDFLFLNVRNFRTTAAIHLKLAVIIAPSMYYTR